MQLLVSLPLFGSVNLSQSESFDGSDEGGYVIPPELQEELTSRLNGPPENLNCRCKRIGLRCSNTRTSLT